VMVIILVVFCEAMYQWWVIFCATAHIGSIDTNTFAEHTRA
jgi:hypothetical protein